jgi:geranylgeranyl diphosphate synthase, type I
MDIYTEIKGCLLAQPLFQTWPDLQRVLERATATRPRDWQLPLVACAAVGGEPMQAIPAAAAIACAQINIILIDGMLDAEPDGEHQRLGMPATANLAAAFQAAALVAMAASDAPSGAKLAALQHLNAMLLTTTLGQYWDTQNSTNEETYWRVVRTKSTPFFGTALYVGAILAGARPEIAEQLKQIGDLHGEMIQIHDDLNDTMAAPANSDWTLGRSPLPILFAQNVEHSERARFMALRAEVTKTPDPNILAEAQAILIRCGAVSYGVAHLVSRYQQAKALVEVLPVQYPERLVNLIEELITPVWALCESLDISLSGTRPESTVNNL